MRFSAPASVTKIAPDPERTTANGLPSDATTVVRPDGVTRTSRCSPFSTTRSDPPGSTSMPVGQTNVSGFPAAAAPEAAARVTAATARTRLMPHATPIRGVGWRAVPIVVQVVLNPGPIALARC
jgi:hypothetical protein